MQQFSSLFLMLLVSVVALGNPVEIDRIFVESKINPLGVAERNPKFSWQLKTLERNVKQTGFRILVADNIEAIRNNTGTIWDSGKNLTDQSIQVKFSGRTLRAGQTYYWRVMVWHNLDPEPALSDIGEWQMGLLEEQDWEGAKWIAFDELAKEKVDVLPESEKKDTWFGNNILPILRKDFKVEKPLKKATLFISGLGHFEASINGEKIDDNFLDPGWVKYDKEALYVSFDISKNLINGTNTIGVMLGNGFYFIPPVKGRFRKQKVAFGFPKMISLIRLEYQDGTFKNIISDGTWRTAKGPITFSSLYGGEDYDARLEQEGWNKPYFNDAQWKSALVVQGPPTLNSQKAEPLKVFNRFKPKTHREVRSGEWVFDLGQNASGIIELSVKGRRGDTVRVYLGELLDNGEVTQKATGGPYYFEYVLKGEGVETWRPRFSYYGFRYVQIKGAVPTGEANSSGIPEMINLVGLHTRNSARQTGSFNTSDTLFNQIDDLINWAIKSNMASIFTDCPHREKLGWLEQTHLMGPSVRYNYDITSLGQKVVRDMINSQLPNGLVPEIAPEFVNFTWGGDMFRDSPEWGSSSIILPWYLYQWYGDLGTLEQAFPMMERYIEYLQEKAVDYILLQGLGDWYDLGPERPGVSQLTPMGVTGTAIYYYDLTIMAKISKLLGKHDQEKKYRELAGKVRTAFNNKFYNPTKKYYATNSQTANAMAVYMELVDPVNKGAVVENIINDIIARNYRFTTGDIGHRYLLQVLQQEGRSDLIYKMNSRTDVPGYGYQIMKGATALTESWQALPVVSNNHFMLGHLMEWFYGGLAGIQQAANSIAFKEIQIYPNVVGDISAVAGSYDSPYGKIMSSWKKDSLSFTLSVTVPPNTSATIFLPGSPDSRITEQGKPLTEVGLSQPVFKNGRFQLVVGSGSYEFTLFN